MTVQLEVTQTRTVESGEAYRVVTSVGYNSGIDRCIFVYNTDTEEYQHVATPWDIENRPNNRVQALADGDAYYRLASVLRDSDTVAVAEAFAVYTLGRIEMLAREYARVVTSFEGSGTYVYSYTGE